MKNQARKQEKYETNKMNVTFQTCNTTYICLRATQPAQEFRDDFWSVKAWAATNYYFVIYLFIFVE